MPQDHLEQIDVGLGAADATLKDAATGRKVAGSIVLDDDLMGYTFVKTGNPRTNGLLGAGDIHANFGNAPGGVEGDSLLVAEDIGAPVDYDRDIYLNGSLVHVPARAIVLVFDNTNWQKANAKKAAVAAVDDTRAEGERGDPAVLCA